MASPLNPRVAPYLRKMQTEFSQISFYLSDFVCEFLYRKRIAERILETTSDACRFWFRLQNQVVKETRYVGCAIAVQIRQGTGLASARRERQCARR
jgi:hypothetical protein